jgi:uncharacterized protein involved in exopolysaccharide biosynthesis
MAPSRSWKLVVQRVIDTAWRRRGLLITPIILLLPISVLVALFMPGGYTAQSLVLMKERSSSNPLSRDDNLGSSWLATERVQQITSGVQALLLSDYVLSQVVDAFNGNYKDPGERETKIRELRRRVSVRLVGTDFLEFQIAGNRPTGLGRELELVITRLAETLVNQNGLSIAEFVPQVRRQELESAERRYWDLRDRLESSRLADPHSGEDPASLNRQLDETKRDLVAKKAEMDLVRAQLNMDEAQAQRAIGEAGMVQDLSTGPLLRYKELVYAHEVLTKKAANLSSRIETLQRQSALQREVALAEQQLAVKREAYDASKKQFSAVANRGDSFMSAPERMVLIDLPRDPIGRSKSRLVFVFAGALGGALIGLALVLLVEISDDRIRYLDDVWAVTQLPILARMPRSRDSIIDRAQIPRLAVVNPSLSDYVRTSDVRDG